MILLDTVPYTYQVLSEAPPIDEMSTKKSIEVKKIKPSELNYAEKDTVRPVPYILAPTYRRVCR